ncbi:DUF3783 domain-containing protein [Clostridium sp. C105KSO13]|uniref:DUF3783 domain-containing protein n=1 Tax=Clostridium sp. C105KSO13 TaxID=1776045 RepID=UPI0007407DD9|nr:DUF3783 domain-containing protein [Clostridium sp. C105KSO13]CUX20271.1 hypothetical protein BN3456_00401 [Clostridium sp. C105KSO13]
MKETILLFHIPEKEKRLKIEMALFPLHVRLKYIMQEDYHQPLGVLAGIKDAVPAEGSYTGEDLPDTMIVFAFFSDSRLNQALAALRKSGVGPLSYKAVLTPTNQLWTAPECFAELRQEHEALN